MGYLATNNKKVLVTGGTRGIGYAIAELFLEQEAEVHVTGTKVEGEGPHGSIYHSCDFTSKGNLEKFCNSLKKLGINVLINNAGINKTSAFCKLSPEDFLSIQQVNLYSAFRMIQAVLPGMISNEWGRIVNITSIFSIVSKEFRATGEAAP